ncbi:hypothetical protein AKJ43_03580 [candidate division MSBL1 archaeon SCGC-AAA261D19]|uniref:Antitoxin n=1 Tax=candidate division MSBL1 archaeon SCGC-AAA261D19 TaxID=1698273 RepID=A0A133V418_9EURY|nr:hypothetical protein AKJ43_03580 [candidate division MSBL1 archaeon SCGC-AAA261D19]
MRMAVEVKYKVVGDHVEIPKEEFDSLIATIETLEDQEVINQLMESEKAKKEGRVRKWKEVKKEL